MQTLGERLEEARKRKGISIREAAEATKIRGDYLQKFEANSFDLDLPPLYVRGFVRNYARFLELDAARFLSEYDALLAGSGRAPRREQRENLGRVEFGGGDGEGAPAGDSAGSGNGLDPVMLKYLLFGGGAVALTVIVLLLVNLFSGRVEPRSAATKQETAPATAPATLPAEANPQVQSLTLTATDSTRIKIVQDSDKTTIYEGALARGESRTFRKAGKLLITVEKGSNLRMEVNGRSYPIPLEGYGRFALD